MSSGFTWQFRPVGEFLDVGAFKLPATSGDLMDRLSVNGGYYAFNYLFLYAVLLLFLSLQKPPLLFASVAIAAGGYYLFHMRTEPLVIGGTRLTEEQLRLIYLSISALLFLYAGGWPMLYVTAVTALLALIHAALRQRSLKSRGSTSMAGVKEAIKREVNDVQRQVMGGGNTGGGGRR